MKICYQREIICKYCKQQLKHYDIYSHINESCPEIIEKCELCGKKRLRKDINNHKEDIYSCFDYFKENQSKKIKKKLTEKIRANLSLIKMELYESIMNDNQKSLAYDKEIKNSFREDFEMISQKCIEIMKNKEKCHKNVRSNNISKDERFNVVGDITEIENLKEKILNRKKYKVLEENENEDELFCNENINKVIKNMEHKLFEDNKNKFKHEIQIDTDILDNENNINDEKKYYHKKITKKLDEKEKFEYNITKAKIEFKQKNYKKSAKFYKRALVNNLNNIECWYKFASCLNYLGRYTDAIYSFKKVIELDASYHNYLSYYKLGEINYKLGNHKEAIRKLNKVISNNKDYSKAYFIKGKSLLSLKEFKDAKVCFTKVLNLCEETDENFIEAVKDIESINNYIYDM